MRGRACGPGRQRDRPALEPRRGLFRSPGVTTQAGSVQAGEGAGVRVCCLEGGTDFVDTRRCPVPGWLSVGAVPVPSSAHSCLRPGPGSRRLSASSSAVCRVRVHLSIQTIGAKKHLGSHLASGGSPESVDCCHEAPATAQPHVKPSGRNRGSTMSSDADRNDGKE